jgi:hypothetical protein
MWRAAFVGAILATGCGQAADSPSGNGGAATSGNGGAATSAGGARGWRDAGTALATGGKPLTPEEAACNAVFYDVVPASTDAGHCEFAVPAALPPLSQGITVLLTATNGLKRYEPFFNSPGDCVLNRDHGWYYNRSETPQTIVLCPATCAAASSGEYRLTVGCERPIRDRTM